MPWKMDEKSFAKLLSCLDADRERAGEKYEHLRSALQKIFEKRGVTNPEECTDEVFDRAAHKLDEGVEIRNLGGFCYEIARFVSLEHFKSPASHRVPLDEDILDKYARKSHDSTLVTELQYACLDHCLAELPIESRALITEYYRYEGRERINRRRELAAQMGVNSEALANRTQRLRNNLETCIVRCYEKKLRYKF